MSDASSRTPLLLLAGLLCDRQVWEEVAELLDDVAEPSIVSFAGCRSIPEMAEKVLTMAPERFALAGHSMGGRVALEVFRQAPARITRLALLNTGVHPRRDAEVAGRQQLLEIAANRGMAAVADEWLPPMISPGGRQYARLMQQLRQMILRHTAEDFSGQIQALLDRPDAEEVLPLVDVPTLLLSGTDDQWSPVAQHAEMQRQLPGSQLVALEAAGHMSTVEAPAAVAGALRTWLTS